VPWGCCGPADRMLARVVAPVGGDIRTTTVGGRHVPFPRPSWGEATTRLRGRSAGGTGARREGRSAETTHNDSSEWTGGFSRSETSGWQAEGSAHPRAGRTPSKSDRGFMTIHLSPADAPCRVTAGDVNHNQTDGGGKERERCRCWALAYDGGPQSSLKGETMGGKERGEKE